MRKILFFLFSFLLYLISYSQQPGMRNFTSLDGLSSNEVFRSLLASDGYMWFATDNGVCRFDGANFKTFTIADGLTENTILDLTEDEQGRIWFVGLSGKLSYFFEGEIHPFQWNNLILKSKGNSGISIPGLLSPLSLHHVKMSFDNGISLEINNNQVSSYDLNKGDSLSINTINDRYQTFITQEGTEYYTIHTIFDSIPYSYRFKTQSYWIHHFSKYLYQEYDDRIIYFYGSYAITIFRDGRIEKKDLGLIVVSSLKGVYGGIWIASYKNGLRFYNDISFNDQPTIQFLKKQSITSINYDQNNRGWVTCSYGGVFYVQSISITNYLSNTSISESYLSKALQIDNQHQLFFNKNNTVFMLSDFSKPLKKFIIPQLKKQLVYSAKLFNNKIYLAFTEGLLEIPTSFFLDPKSSNNKITTYHFSNIKDFVFQDSTLWIGTGKGLLRVPISELDSTSIHNSRYYIIKGQRINKILCLPSNSSKAASADLLYHTLDKLMHLRYNKNAISQFQTNVYNKNIRKRTYSNDFLIREKDQSVFVATKGNGLEMILKDTTIYFGKKDGLLSNNINVLNLPNDSLLIMGTNQGINILQLTTSPNYPAIKKSIFITTEDGLRGNEINDIIYKNNHIIAATNLGVSYINVPNVIKTSDSFPIYITDFIVNGKEIKHKPDECINLKNTENNIQISFNALDFHDKKNIHYYYRLLGVDRQWKEISKSSIIFPLLDPNTYTFEIKARNSYNYTSNNIAIINFTIHHVFYKTTWFIMLVFVFSLVIIAFFIFIIFSRRNEKLKNEKLIAEYNQQLLIRAIKPHFIFNSLNSASSFLMNNDKKEAISYINQIASLIRNIFEHSSQNSIIIRDEIKLHENYIKIEQQRIHPKFGYSIKAEREVIDTEIPAFMSQVFIENSIWHGFAKEKQKGRYISITYRKKDKYIVCNITDNGIGREASIRMMKEFQEKLANEKKEHGIEVIKRRIASINRCHSIPLIILDIQDVKSNSGKALGTRVIIKYHERIIKERRPKPDQKNS